MPKSSNATSSAFGWEFQSNAAIMLMLDNIKEASKVKVEGENEDVEITFSNGKTLMAQAKAVEDPNDFSNVKTKLEEALRTLNAASKIIGVEHLVYITNSPNPFNSIQTMHKFSGPINRVPFSELPPICQNKINDICSKNGYNIDRSMLMVCVMQFHGESEDERYKVLHSSIMEFFNRIEVYKVSVNKILSLWQTAFRVNSSQRTYVITKESMMWSIIAIQCEVHETDLEDDDYDEADVTEILRKYKAIINNYSERFEFVSTVLSDFSDFYPATKSKERVKRFISERWEQYKRDFDLKNTDTDIEKIVIQLTLSKILKSRREIVRIKGRVKL